MVAVAAAPAGVLSPSQARAMVTILRNGIASAIDSQTSAAAFAKLMESRFPDASDEQRRIAWTFWNEGLKHVAGAVQR